jgi:DNA-binding response OmpR family regulator
MKVLLVEDDTKIATAVKRGLEAEGFSVEIASDGDDGFWRATEYAYDVIVLDIMLPKRNGFRVCADLRAAGDWTPILMLTAKDGELDEAEALDSGADDYLVKPFSMKELVARVRAASRRGTRGQEENRGEAIEIEELRIDPGQVQAYIDGKSAELTPTEFRLLYALALEKGRVVSRDELLQKLWGRREGHRDRTVDVFVRKLRDKIDRQASRHAFIHTRYGVGYKLEAVPKS